MKYRLSYTENFHFSNLLAASEAGCLFGPKEGLERSIISDAVQGDRGFGQNCQE